MHIRNPNKGPRFLNQVPTFPVFYLLVLYCQSNAPTGPATIGNKMSDLMYMGVSENRGLQYSTLNGGPQNKVPLIFGNSHICQLFFTMAGGHQVPWADIIQGPQKVG